MTDANERLRRLIDEEQDRLRAGVPGNRGAAIAALVNALDRLPGGAAGHPDRIFGHRLTAPGGNKALQLCLESVGTGDGSHVGLDGWAVRMMTACDHLSGAEMVLAHCETGFMRLACRANDWLDAWISTSHAPARWVERANYDWWASWLAGKHAPRLEELQNEQLFHSVDGAERDAAYLRLARLHIETMYHQLSLPADAGIGRLTIQVHLDALTWLVAQALAGRDRGEAVSVRSEQALAVALASFLGIDPGAALTMLAAFTMDRDGAARHAAVPGIAAAPLVRVGPDAAILSARGLTTEPLLFLARELRRRDAMAYHNVSHLRENVFRQDVYDLFRDRRFVTSPGPIELRRAAGSIRTDIDAAIFDRKSGALAIFELKSQDPFASSSDELMRQRDNFLQAGRQISGVLDWINQHGANEILNRMDRRTAKSFRVQKVVPFVLGRYLAHVDQGRTPDARVAWGSWPQVLRLLDDQHDPAQGSNPMASLGARLAKDVPATAAPSTGEPMEIMVGDARLAVYESYAAYRQRQ